SPSWSPDGRAIGFVRLDVVSGRNPMGEIYRMNADGSGATALTRSPAWYLSPLWSPDGQTLAFSLTRRDTSKWTIAVIDATGGDPRVLTDGGGNDILDSWSPDGTRLLFHSDRTGRPQVFVMNADGSGQTRLTNVGDNWGGAWSPRGDTIAFASSRGGRLQIYTMDSTGRGQRRLLGWRGATLPVGSLTLILTLNAALMSVLGDQYRLIPAAIVAGLLGDLVLWRLRPAVERPASVRLFAFAVPVIFYSCYMLALQL